MSDLFDTLVDRVIAKEGGYTNNPNDRGGATIWGITETEARSNGYVGLMQNMPREIAVAMYRVKYWNAPGFARIAPLSAKVAEELFDTGVNMGVGTAGKFFQRSLNALNVQAAHYPDIAVDGAIGPGTAAAFTAYMKRHPQTGESVMLKCLNCLQGARYIELSEARGQNETFTNGWLANRVGIPS